MDLPENAYILGSSHKEFQRLYLQSLAFEKETTHTLGLAGIEYGMKCLDVGCGLGDSTSKPADKIRCVWE